MMYTGPLACSGFHDNAPGTGSLHVTETHCLPVLGSRSLKSRHGQGHAPSETWGRCFLALPRCGGCGWPRRSWAYTCVIHSAFTPHGLSLSVCLRGHLLISTLVILELTNTSVTQLITSTRTLFPNKVILSRGVQDFNMRLSVVGGGTARPTQLWPVDSARTPCSHWGCSSEAQYTTRLGDPQWASCPQSFLTFSSVATEVSVLLSKALPWVCVTLASGPSPLGCLARLLTACAPGPLSMRGMLNPSPRTPPLTGAHRKAVTPSSAGLAPAPVRGAPRLRGGPSPSNKSKPLRNP